MSTASRRFPLPLSIAAAATLCASPAFAQTTGAIGGQVYDGTTQAPIRDAVVIAQSPSLQGEQTAVTDETGQFEISLLPSGVYSLTVQRDGYQPFTQTGLTVRLDRSIKIKLMLQPDTFAGPSVEIVSQKPVVTVDSVQAGQTISSQQMSLIPYGRNSRGFEAVATSVPGVQSDRYGLQIAGSSSPESNYIIDGVNVSNPAFGGQGTSLIQDFIEEVDVKTGGYRAEYGRSTGAVINVVTKSGGNEFHGSIFGNYTPFELTRKQIARRGEAVAGEQRQRYNLDFGAELGGPILKDKLWFFAGFAPQIISVNNDRVINARTSDASGQPILDANGVPLVHEIARKSYPGTETSYQFSGKLTYLANENHSIALAVYGNPSKTTGAPNTAGNAPPGVNGNAGSFNYDRTGGSTDVSLRYAGKLLNKSMLVEATAGYHHQVLAVSAASVGGVPAATIADSPSIQWRQSRNLLDPVFTSDPAVPDYQLSDAVRAGCAVQANGFDPCPVNFYLTGGPGGLFDRKLNRLTGALKLSNFVDLLGHHQFKYGVDAARDTFDNFQYLSGGVTAQARGTATSYRFRIRQYGHEDRNIPGQPAFDPANPDQLADSAFTNRTKGYSFAAFVQDSWSIFDKVVLDIGLRAEKQLIYGDPKTLDANGLPLQGAQVNLSNLAPRVGLIYDWTGRGLSKVYGSFGRFYDYIPLELADFDLSALTQVAYYRNADSCRNPRDPRTCAILPNQYSGGTRTFQFQGSPSSTPVDPNLSSQYVTEFQTGAQYQFYRDVSLGVDFTHRSLDSIVEDISVDQANTYFITNPGVAGKQGYIVTDPATGKQVREPLANRKYDGVTLSVNKAFSANYLLSASYTFSRLTGNYNGLILPENGELLPHVNTEYDFLSQNPNKQGPMAGDIPHAFKVDGAYLYEYSPSLNLTFGGNLRAAAGQPVNYLGTSPELYGATFILPRGSGGRLPWTWELNLRAAAAYRLGKGYTVALSVDVLNATNNRQATSVDETYASDTSGVYPIVNGKIADLAYLRNSAGQPAVLNTNYRNPTSFQRPLSARFGAKLSF